MDSARSMLVHAYLPQNFWGEAILTASHLHNLCPHPSLPDTTPHEQLFGSKPDVHYLGVFGCDAFAKIHTCSKLDPQAEKFVFVGYSPNQKGYCLYSPSDGSISVHRDVTFHENSFSSRTWADSLHRLEEFENTYDSDYTPQETSLDRPLPVSNTEERDVSLPRRVRYWPHLAGDDLDAFGQCRRRTT